ncbi:MAG: hypothetical protein B6I23_01765 [Rickettsiaceae bacterium 4572_127]|nr:MAG: hypothetical protein B6I23_01765 [Rickettsiaceae bacterium 4572_127]
MIIELDGGQHNEDKNIKYDNKRTKILEKAGFKILRFWNCDVFENLSGVLETIYLELKNDPSPK